jgi:hypothetical protein
MGTDFRAEQRHVFQHVYRLPVVMADGIPALAQAEDYTSGETGKLSAGSGCGCRCQC